MKRPIPGIVLAGGESRRMGRDKATVLLHGRALVAWTVAQLAPQCSAVAISRHADGYDAPLGDVALPIVVDEAADRFGPLSGLLAGLDWVAEAVPDAHCAVTVAVDTPFLPHDFVDRLEAGRRASGARAAVAASSGRRHPVAALWPVAARHALRDAMLREGLRRVGLFLDRLGPATVDWPSGPADPFLNINTPDDLAAAEMRAAAEDGCGRHESGSESPSRWRT